MKKETDKRDKVAIGVFSFLILALLAAFIVLNSGDISRITGYGTSGQVNITISQNLSINVLVMNMSFGVGEVVPGRAHATINSSTHLPTITTAMLSNANWTNTSVFNPSSFQLINDGNVNASVTLQGSAAAQAFIGGTSPNFEFNASNAEANSCLSGIASWTTVSGSPGQTVCTNFCANDNRDLLYVDCRLTIPADTQGAKETFFTFGATAVV